MSDKERKSGPRKSAKGEASERERRQRQAEQLRANLLRRKAQSRNRTADAGAGGPDDGNPAGGLSLATPCDRHTHPLVILPCPVPVARPVVLPAYRRGRLRT